MMKKWIFFFMFVSLAFVSRAQIYKWTDNQGNVHFSDQPQKGAEKVELPQIQTFSPPPVPDSSQSGNNQVDDDDATVEYESFAIIQPTNEATIRNNQGYVNVSVQIEPQLQEGDQLQLVYDGQDLGKPQVNPSFSLNEVERGEHTVAVKIINASGKVIGTTDSVTFYMHRPRVGMVPATRR